MNTLLLQLRHHLVSLKHSTNVRKLFRFSGCIHFISFLNIHTVLHDWIRAFLVPLAAYTKAHPRPKSWRLPRPRLGPGRAKKGWRARTAARRRGGRRGRRRGVGPAGRHRGGDSDSRGSCVCAGGQGRDGGNGDPRGTNRRHEVGGLSVKLWFEKLMVGGLSAKWTLL